MRQNNFVHKLNCVEAICSRFTVIDSYLSSDWCDVIKEHSFIIINIIIEQKYIGHIVTTTTIKVYNIAIFPPFATHYM